jgi:hypothetical protein
MDSRIQSIVWDLVSLVEMAEKEGVRFWALPEGSCSVDREKTEFLREKIAALPRLVVEAGWDFDEEQFEKVVGDDCPF